MDKLIRIIRSVISDDKLNYKITQTDIKKAQYHKVESFLYLACDKEITDKKIVESIKKIQFKAIQKDAIQLKELDEILQIFERNQIDCLPLKGSVIKSDYPFTFLRYMGDIDILIREKDMKKAVQLLETKEYITKSDSYNHLSMEKLPYVEVELHRHLLPYQQEGEDLLTGIWDRLVLKEGSGHIYQMSEEDFLIFMLLHLHKHYQVSGTGIRSFLDIYLFLQKHKDLNFNYIDDSLNRVNLKETCLKYIEFSDKLFNLEKMDNDFLTMKERVKNSGVFGSSKVRMETDLSNNKQSPIRLIFRKIFPLKRMMIQRYPVLKHHIFLLPIFYVLRLLRLIIISPVSSIKRVVEIIKFQKK
jgi:predicted nucleotidyltransferase